jgi:hypothetical protein
MQLADACWRRTERGAAAGPGEWTGAVDDARRSVATSMERMYSGFGQGEKSALRAVARTGKLFGAGAELLDLAKGSATHARETLIDSGDLAATDDGVAIVDPLLADWLRERFPI